MREFLNTPFFRSEPLPSILGIRVDRAPSNVDPGGTPCQLRQVYVLSGRQLSNLVRHPLLLGLQYGSVAAAALVIGAVFYETGYDTAGIQNRLGSLFFMVLFLAMLSLSTLPVWRDQRLLFLQVGRDNTCDQTLGGALFEAMNTQQANNWRVQRKGILLQYAALPATQATLQQPIKGTRVQQVGAKQSAPIT